MCITLAQITISPEQCRIARVLLNLSQAELAEAAHVARATLADFERGTRVPTHNNIQAIRTVLESAGIAFIPANEGGLGARLRVARTVGTADEMTVSLEQCRAARAVLNLSQTELAGTAGVGRSTVSDFESASRKPNRANLAALRDALEAAGIVFIDPNGGGPGLRLRE